MQRKALQPGKLPSVHEIPAQGMAQMAQMAADLVGAARLQPQLQQRPAAALLQHPEMGHGTLPLRADAPADAAALLPADGQVDDALRRKPRPLRHRPVDPPDLAPGQRILQPLGGQLVDGHGHQAGGPPVQPVDGPKGRIFAPLQQIGHHPVAQSVAVIMPRAGMDGQPGRLVEDHQIPVLIHDIQRACLWLHPLFPAGIRLPQDGKHLSGQDPLPHRHPNAVQRNAVFRLLQLPQQIGGDAQLPLKQGQHLLPAVLRTAEIVQPLQAPASLQHMPAAILPCGGPGRNKKSAACHHCKMQYLSQDFSIKK